MIAFQDRVTAALEARTESTAVDFKGSFDPASKGEWIEVVKDIAAFANSGGGALVFGVDDSGNSSGLNCQPILNFDIARVGDKFRKYTGTNLSDLALFGCTHDGCDIACLCVGTVDVPLVFIADGQYLNSAGDERFAFRAGTIYFRHGAKSEPGTTEDLRQFLDQRIATIRESWLSRIRQVVESPAGSEIRVVTPTDGSTADVTNVCIVTDGSGDPRRLVHADDSHRHRQIDVIRLVNERLAPEFVINQANVQDIRKVHRVEEKPQFYHKGKLPGALTQFSDAFVDWIVESYRKDAKFFAKARAARQALNRARVDARSAGTQISFESSRSEEIAV